MQSSIKHLLKHFALVLKAKLNQLKHSVGFVLFYIYKKKTEYIIVYQLVVKLLPPPNLVGFVFMPIP